MRPEGEGEIDPIFSYKDDNVRVNDRVHDTPVIFVGTEERAAYWASRNPDIIYFFMSSNIDESVWKSTRSDKERVKNAKAAAKWHRERFDFVFHPSALNALTPTQVKEFVRLALDDIDAELGG